MMTSKTIAAKLKALGFAYDENVTCKTTYWAGTIDAIGSYSIAGECRGIAVSGQTRAEMDAEAVQEAQAAAPLLEPCADPACELHNPDDAQ